MEECRTPTYLESVEFKFACTTPTNLNTIQGMQNLMVNKMSKLRCYTPTLKDLRSPGLSPIGDIQSPVTPAMKTHLKNFVMEKMRYTPSPMLANMLSTKDNSFGMNFTVKSDSDSDNSSLNGSQKSTSILNHALNVAVLLKTVGLEEYLEVFENFGLDNFLTIQPKDLEKLGLHSKEHCQIIMDLLKDLNNA